MTAGGVREFREKLVQWNRAAKFFYKASKAIAAPTIAIVTGDPHPHIGVGKQGIFPVGHFAFLASPLVCPATTKLECFGGLCKVSLWKSAYQSQTYYILYWRIFGSDKWLLQRHGGVYAAVSLAKLKTFSMRYWISSSSVQTSVLLAMMKSFS